MRGKKPSEREKYMLRADSGTFVEVTREVYLEWHRAGRRERYQMEKKRAHGVCSLETLGENIQPAIPGGYWENTPEENAIRSACMEKLRESLACLPEQHSQAAPCGNGKQGDYKRQLLACMYPYLRWFMRACCGKYAVIFYAGTIREWPETGAALNLAQTGKSCGLWKRKACGIKNKRDEPCVHNKAFLLRR